MSNTFRLPIQYNEHFQTPKNIIDDLEILNSRDISSNLSSLNILFNPQTDIEKLILNNWSEYYTNDTYFLKDSQQLISKLFDSSNSNINNESCFIYSNKKANDMLNVFNELKNDTNFKSKYFYIDVKFFEKLNENATAMQALCVYNMASPLITLITPIIFLVLPFFLLKLQKIPISTSQYFIIIKKLLREFFFNY